MDTISEKCPKHVLDGIKDPTIELSEERESPLPYIRLTNLTYPIAHNNETGPIKHKNIYKNINRTTNASSSVCSAMYHPY